MEPDPEESRSGCHPFFAKPFQSGIVCLLSYSVLAGIFHRLGAIEK